MPLHEIDLRATPTGWMVSMPLPGLESKDVHVSVEADMLRISSARKGTHDETSGHFQLRERSLDTFMRAFALPQEADLARVKADLSAGILTITIPRKEVSP